MIAAAVVLRTAVPLCLTTQVALACRCSADFSVRISKSQCTPLPEQAGWNRRCCNGRRVAIHTHMETEMHYRIVLLSLPALPAAADAHGGPHAGLHGLGWLVHLVGQHGPAALAGTLVAMLLLAGYRGVRHRTARTRRAGIRPGGRRG
jgi:hypothetical protein